MPPKYFLKSTRLGFRNWKTSDIPKMFTINADPEVMAFFPSLPTIQETENFVKRMQIQFTQKGYCYFAVDCLDEQNFIGFIGFIGISDQNYPADFTPCIDIGWRLAKETWNKGFATEGAKRCLEFAFTELGLEKINAIAPQINVKSEQVMKKIGMNKVKTFEHPLLRDNERLKTCVLYEIKNLEK